MTGFSGGLGNPEVMVCLDDPKGVFQDSMSGGGGSNSIFNPNNLHISFCPGWWKVLLILNGACVFMGDEMRLMYHTGFMLTFTPFHVTLAILLKR